MRQQKPPKPRVSWWGDDSGDQKVYYSGRGPVFGSQDPGQVDQVIPILGDRTLLTSEGIQTHAWTIARANTDTHLRLPTCTLTCTTYNFK